MYDDILFGFRHTLVGVTPNPGLAASRPVEHACRRGYAAPFGRPVPHIRAEHLGAVPPSVDRWPVFAVPHKIVEPDV